MKRFITTILMVFLLLGTHGLGATSSKGDSLNESASTTIVDSLENKVESLPQKYHELESTLEDIKQTENENKNKIITLSFAVIGLLVFILILTIWQMISRIRLRSNVLRVLTREIKDKHSDPRLDRFKDEIVQKVATKNRQIDNNSQLVKNKELSEDDVIRLINRQLRELSKDSQVQFANKVTQQSKRQESKQHSQQSKQEVKSIILYADAIVNAKFNQVTSSVDSGTTNFELKVNPQNLNEADITIYKDAYDRMLINHSFLEGCDKQVVNADYSAIKIDNFGKAVKNADGTWLVKQKLRVILE